MFTKEPSFPETFKIELDTELEIAHQQFTTQFTCQVSSYIGLIKVLKAAPAPSPQNLATFLFFGCTWTRSTEPSPDVSRVTEKAGNSHADVIISYGQYQKKTFTIFFLYVCSFSLFAQLQAGSKAWLVADACCHLVSFLLADSLPFLAELRVNSSICFIL